MRTQANVEMPRGVAGIDKSKLKIATLKNINSTGTCRIDYSLRLVFYNHILDPHKITNGYVIETRNMLYGM